MADPPAVPTMPTMPTYGHPTVFVYPTVSPRVVVVPILSCIFGFPVLVMLVICGLRYRAQRARMRAKKAKGLEFSMMEFSVEPSIPLRYTNGKMQRSSHTKKKTLVRFKPMPELDLDTVVEEKSEFDAEMTASDLLTTPEEIIIREESPPIRGAGSRSNRNSGSVRSTGNINVGFFQYTISGDGSIETCDVEVVDVPLSPSNSFSVSPPTTTGLDSITVENECGVHKETGDSSKPKVLFTSDTLDLEDEESVELDDPPGVEIVDGTAGVVSSVPEELGTGSETMERCDEEISKTGHPAYVCAEGGGCGESDKGCSESEGDCDTGAGAGTSAGGVRDAESEPQLENNVGKKPDGAQPKFGERSEDSRRISFSDPLNCVKFEYSCDGKAHKPSKLGKRSKSVKWNDSVEEPLPPSTNDQHPQQASSSEVLLSQAPTNDQNEPNLKPALKSTTFPSQGNSEPQRPRPKPLGARTEDQKSLDGTPCDGSHYTRPDSYGDADKRDLSATSAGENGLMQVVAVAGYSGSFTLANGGVESRKARSTPV